MGDQPTYALGWRLSDAVRCDPAYRHRVTRGGVQGEGGRFQGRGQGGARVERLRWTTTLRPEALAILRAMADAQGMDRNEVVERLLFAADAGALRLTDGSAVDTGPADAVIGGRVSRPLADRLAAAAAAAGQTPSAWLRALLARALPVPGPGRPVRPGEPSRELLLPCDRSDP